jgi:hypothetical protein
MKRAKHWWSRVPTSVRKPIVLIVGCLFILAAGLTGWLPGPGGIPLFLIGVAILATEFEKAERFRDRILGIIKLFGVWFRAHKIIGTALCIIGAAVATMVAIFSYKHFR